MSQPDEAPQADAHPPADPWLAFGYLVSGVALYGFVGWLLDRWWDTRFMVLIGVVLGAALGGYQTWARYRVPTE